MRHGAKRGLDFFPKPPKRIIIKPCDMNGWKASAEILIKVIIDKLSNEITALQSDGKNNTHKIAIKNNKKNGLKFISKKINELSEELDAETFKHIIDEANKKFPALTLGFFSKCGELLQILDELYEKQYYAQRDKKCIYSEQHSSQSARHL